MKPANGQRPLSRLRGIFNRAEQRRRGDGAKIDAPRTSSRGIDDEHLPSMPFAGAFVDTPLPARVPSLWRGRFERAVPRLASTLVLSGAGLWAFIGSPTWAIVGGVSITLGTLGLVGHIPWETEMLLAAEHESVARPTHRATVPAPAMSPDAASTRRDVPAMSDEG